MFSIEKLSNNIISIIYKTSNMDKDEREIIEYGALILILKIFNIVSVIIFGVIFGVFLESLVFLFVNGKLRQYSGGVHSKSPGRCIIIGTFISVFIPLCINKIYILLSFDMMIFLNIIILIFCYFIIWKLSPVDSIAKPIVNIEIRKQLKKKSLLTMIVVSILLIALIILYINYKYIILLKLSQCICFALLWQCFTLTASGHIIMGKLDNILKYIIRR